MQPKVGNGSDNGVSLLSRANENISGGPYYLTMFHSQSISKDLIQR